MKTSVCIDAIYRELPFAERIHQAARDGFDYVEFWNSEGRDPEMIRRTLAEAGIALLSFNGDDQVSAVEPDNEAAYLAYLEKQLIFARASGSQALALHSNALDADGRVINAYDEVPDPIKLLNLYGVMEKAARLAEQYDVDLNLEPLNIHIEHVGNFLDNTAVAAEIVKKIGSPRLKVLYDAYHMDVNDEDMTQSIADYWEQIGHIHIADAPGRGEPGTGEIDYPGLLRQLRAVGYQGTIGFEFFPRTDSSAAIAAVRALLNTH